MKANDRILKENRLFSMGKLFKIQHIIMIGGPGDVNPSPLTSSGLFEPEALRRIDPERHSHTPP